MHACCSSHTNPWVLMFMWFVCKHKPRTNHLVPLLNPVLHTHTLHPGLLASQDASDRPSQAITPSLLLIASTHLIFGVLAASKRGTKAIISKPPYAFFSKQASLLIGIASATLWLVDCLLDLLIQSANQLGALLLGKMSTSMLGKRPSPEGDLREEQGGLGVLVRV